MSEDKTFWDKFLEQTGELKDFLSNLKDIVEKYPTNTKEMFPISRSDLLESDYGITLGTLLQDISSLVDVIESIDEKTVLSMRIPMLQKNLSVNMKELYSSSKSLFDLLSPNFTQATNESVPVEQRRPYFINLQQNGDWKIGGSALKPFITNMLNGYEKSWIDVRSMIILSEKISPLLYSDYQNGKTQYLSEIQNIRQSCKTVLKNVEQNHAQIENLLETANSHAEEIDNNHVRSKQNAEDLLQILSEAKESKDELDLLVTENTDLGAKLEAAMANLTKLDLDIKQKNVLYDNETKKMQSLREENEKLLDEIRETIEEADSMLSGATNAALASSFEEKMKNSSQEVKEAEKYYTRVILACLASLVPLFVVLILIGVGSLALQPLTILASLALAAPAFLAQHFAATRYADAVRIHEDYSYKYSIAMGVEGYKKAAPEYADEIAALTFEQIAFNPGDNLKGQKQVKRFVHPAFTLLANKIAPLF